MMELFKWIENNDDNVLQLIKLDDGYMLIITDKAGDSKRITLPLIALAKLKTVTMDLMELEVETCSE